MHFAKPDFFEAIVPDWFPNAKVANQVSGAAEIALGLGMLSPRTRRASAWGLVALTTIVFPANVDMALNKVEVQPADGRMELSRDDVRRVALPALRHRISLNFEGHAEEAGVDGIISDILGVVS